MMAMPEATRSGRRRRLLHAIGVVPYQLRARSGGNMPASRMTHGDDVDCVLVLPQACPQRALGVLDKAMGQLRDDVSARIARVAVADGQEDGGLPQASVYLAFGAAPAAVVAQHLGSQIAQDISVVTFDAPDAVLGAAGKRRLWEALRCLRTPSPDGGVSV